MSQKLKIQLCRWLSQAQAVQSVVKNLPLLLVYLENASHDYPTAEGLFKKLSSVEVLVKLHALNDVLSHLNRLNELYQQENLHPYDVTVCYIHLILQNTEIFILISLDVCRLDLHFT